MPCFSAGEESGRRPWRSGAKNYPCIVDDLLHSRQRTQPHQVSLSRHRRVSIYKDVYLATSVCN
jgi:hypothetical protein